MTKEIIQNVHHSIENALEIHHRPASPDAVTKSWQMVQSAHDALGLAVSAHPRAAEALTLLDNAIIVHESGGESIDGKPSTSANEDAWSMIHASYELLSGMLKSFAAQPVDQASSPTAFTRPGQQAQAAQALARQLAPAPIVPVLEKRNVLDVEQCALDIFVRSQSSNNPDVASDATAFEKANNWARGLTQWRHRMSVASAPIDIDFVEQAAYDIYIHVQTSNVPHAADVNSCLEKALSFARGRAGYRHVMANVHNQANQARR